MTDSLNKGPKSHGTAVGPAVPYVITEGTASSAWHAPRGTRSAGSAWHAVGRLRAARDDDSKLAALAEQRLGVARDTRDTRDMVYLHAGRRPPAGLRARHQRGVAPPLQRGRGRGRPARRRLLPVRRRSARPAAQGAGAALPGVCRTSGCPSSVRSASSSGRPGPPSTTSTGSSSHPRAGTSPGGLAESLLTTRERPRHAVPSRAAMVPRSGTAPPWPPRPRRVLAAPVTPRRPGLRHAAPVPPSRHVLAAPRHAAPPRFPVTPRTRGLRSGRGGRSRRGGRSHIAAAFRQASSRSRASASSTTVSTAP